MRLLLLLIEVHLCLVMNFGHVLYWLTSYYKFVKFYLNIVPPFEMVRLSTGRLSAMSQILKAFGFDFCPEQCMSFAQSTCVMTKVLRTLSEPLIRIFL